jgi:hypothetical protein
MPQNKYLRDRHVFDLGHEKISTMANPDGPTVMNKVTIKGLYAGLCW